MTNTEDVMSIALATLLVNKGIITNEELKQAGDAVIKAMLKDAICDDLESRGFKAVERTK